MGKRRLFFDIETSLAEAYIFRPGYKLNIGWHQIKKHSQIICISYKWEGQKKVYNLDWGKKQSDKEILGKFLKIADTADELVAHNGDKFDIKWIRTRCYFHGLPMMPEYVSIDTIKGARKYFNFPGNSLDAISHYGGGSGKLKTNFDLWVAVDQGKPSALREMKKYCNVDVLTLEAVFQKMRPYMKAKTTIAGYRTDCPECGFENVRCKANRVSGAGVPYKQMQCQTIGCGTYFNVSLPQENRANKLKKLSKR